MAKSKCQRCDTLRNPQLIKVSLWAQRSFASWIALCKSHNAAFCHPSYAGLLNILSICIEGSRLHHCCCELQMSGVFWTPNNVNQCCEKQGYWEILMRQISGLNMKENVKSKQTKNNKTKQLFPDGGNAFKIFFLSLYQKRNKCKFFSQWCAAHSWMMAFNTFFKMNF